MTYSLFDRKPCVVGRRPTAERSWAAPIARAVAALLIGAVGGASATTAAGSIAAAAAGLSGATVAGVAAAAGGVATASAAREVAGSSCPDVEAGLQLPAGFCATVFADHIGHARHLAVSDAGVVYVNTWSGVYFGNAPVPSGGFLVALKDSTGSGRADKIERFGPAAQEGGKGGTGIAIYRGGLYAEEADRILRYTLRPDALTPAGPPETIVEGLPLTGNHPMHPFLIDGKGSLYLDSASATNSCQQQDRQLESPGVEPCEELRTRGGIWRYDANKTGQRFSPAERFASGLRNAEGFALDRRGSIFVTQHGRDQLHSNWPAHYTLQQEATLPAEELLLLRSGADYGWPKCYFDPGLKRLVQAPEYGGDGHRVGDCARKTPPIAYFPAHWGPNGMAYYDHEAFPSRYRRGVFIAFHGSWNRAPFQQDGYNVVFQALEGDKAGRCEVFADGFAGPKKAPDAAAHRPAGIAVAPDGALFVADDVAGRIYRITYRGPAGASEDRGVACPSATATPGSLAAPSAAASSIPEAGAPLPDVAQLPVPRGASREGVMRGARIYRGAEGGATCIGCHGESGGGTPLGPSLRAHHWTWSDGSAAGIAATIRIGVPQPRNYRSPMPAMGGAQLSAEQVRDVAAYVWAIDHASASKPARRTELSIPGERIFPESLTSTGDGRVFIGSIITRQVFLVRAGESAAQTWIAPDDRTSLGFFGLLADERSGTLWACRSAIPDAEHPDPAMLEAYALDSGRLQARYPMPTARAFCNDIAVGPNGAVYVTDSINAQVDRLDREHRSLQVWADAAHFGDPKVFIDGIAVVDGRVLVNGLVSNALYAVSIGADGAAGTSVTLKLSRAIDGPDGMRAFGEHGLLLVEGRAQRLSRVDLQGDAATLTTLREGFTGGPVAVTVVGSQAWVLEGQLQALFAPVEKRKPLTPFRAIGVDLP